MQCVSMRAARLNADAWLSDEVQSVVTHAALSALMCKPKPSVSLTRLEPHQARCGARLSLHVGSLMWSAGTKLDRGQ